MVKVFRKTILNGGDTIRTVFEVTTSKRAMVKDEGLLKVEDITSEVLQREAFIETLKNGGLWNEIVEFITNMVFGKVGE